MKQLFNNSKMIAIGMAALLTVGAANVSFARSGKEIPTQLTYVSNAEGLPVFQLDLNNNEINEVAIVVKDEYGTVLYSEKVKGDHISRRFKLDAEDLDAVAGTTIEVMNRTSGESVTYKISNKSKTVNNVLIEKL
jgi:hypothetical protein